MPSKAKLDHSDLDWFNHTLARVVEGAGSLSEIEKWLADQPFVESATVSDYLLKSHPPQREISVNLKLTDAPVAQKSFRISELGPAEFRFLQTGQG